MAQGICQYCQNEFKKSGPSSRFCGHECIKRNQIKKENEAWIKRNSDKPRQMRRKMADWGEVYRCDYGFF